MIHRYCGFSYQQGYLTNVIYSRTQTFWRKKKDKKKKTDREPGGAILSFTEPPQCPPIVSRKPADRETSKTFTKPPNWRFGIIHAQVLTTYSRCLYSKYVDLPKASVGLYS